MRSRLVTASIWFALLGLAYLTLRAPGLRSRELVAPAGGVDTSTAASARVPSEDDDDNAVADADADADGFFRVVSVSVCVSVSGLPLNGCSFNCAIPWAF
jgi:hypothetical protein